MQKLPYSCTNPILHNSENRIFALFHVSQPPRLAQRFGSQTIGLQVSDKFVLHRIVIDFSTEEEGDVRRVASDVRIAGRVSVGFRLTTRLYAIEKITDVECGRITADLRNFSAGEQFG